jgi:hypothetical protein
MSPERTVTMQQMKNVRQKEKTSKIEVLHIYKSEMVRLTHFHSNTLWGGWMVHLVHVT